MNVYFLSGLGADSRIFRHINLPEGFEANYIEWIPPTGHETLKEYAHRLSENIDKTKPFVLIGVSMGGMVACEIASIAKPFALIIISSCPSSTHLPSYFPIYRRLKLAKLTSIKLIKFSLVTKRLFTGESKEDKQMLTTVIKESDPQFIRWAMTAILEWNTKDTPEHFIHIHGSADGVLPSKYTNPTHLIKGGGHMMILSKAKQINEIIKEVLSEKN